MPKSQYTQFSDRLHHAWDLAGLPQGDSRTGAVAERYEVSRESARKWGLGKSIPRTQRLRTIAVESGVNYDWLSTGRGEIMSSEQSVREPPSEYESSVMVRLNAAIRKLSLERQLALLQLLEG
ncbi:MULTISPECIES: DNA-binding protein [unclassified Lysobacter]|uniref:DNA-binding protein n=1 Tax=unclassified Lysobacter TaxID=2635362 RepID=UPI001C24F207|nr:DNA-binding protein [Lysobacter sp. MMG2]MBU8977973.1 DNA-binding protein [Lysobacter sp. MMG2]